MGFLYICCVVLGITTVAYLAKLSARHNVPSFDFTFVLFTVASVFGYFFAGFNRVSSSAYTIQLWLISIGAGFGGATAVFIFNRAVRIGHFGYSNAIYRSSFLIPVILSVIVYNAKLNLTTVAGIVSIVISIFLVSWSDNVFNRVNGNIRWFFFIASAFLMSGLPRMGQLLVSHNKLNSSAYLFASYTASAVLLLIIFLFKPKKIHLLALLYGTIAAFASFAGVYCTIEALRNLPASVVFPVTLSAPIILGMLISFLHKERIRPAGWAGVFLGITGILILSFQAYKK
ncbi:MAG: DMT family transporter [Fibrobacter sp.]|nr:DMT family transporter [Fibrobacter sp.]